MYLLYSIHPKTSNLTLRGGYKEYNDATEALQEQVQSFLNYKGQKNLLYINNKEEITSNSDSKYFLKISGKFPNKISIYEKKKVDNSGMFFSGIKEEIIKIMVFSFIECSFGLGDQSNTNNSQSVATNTISTRSPQNNDEFQTRLKNTTNKTTQMTHGTHVKYISELKEVLSARRNFLN